MSDHAAKSSLAKIRELRQECHRLSKEALSEAKMYPTDEQVVRHAVIATGITHACEQAMAGVAHAMAVASPNNEAATNFVVSLWESCPLAINSDAITVSR